MKPVILYVDDEPMNLTVFEAAMPENFEVWTFDNAKSALDKINELNPWIVVSDQRMPGMVGVDFLEKVKLMQPLSKRMIVTGYSDEDLVVESIRKAQISDYIRKPWDVDDLVHRVSNLVDVYLLEKDNLNKSLELEKKNSELLIALNKAQELQNSEKKLRQELESWSPPFLLEELDQVNKKFPCKKNLAVIMYDIKNSSDLHDKYFNNISVRSIILHGFTKTLLKYGGWRESHAGDSAMGHIGLLKEIDNACDILLVAAMEFKSFLEKLSDQLGYDVACGIGLHYAENCLVDIHNVDVNFDNKQLKQKSFDATGSGIDLVYRIEKLAHEFKGNNLVITKNFKDRLNIRKYDLKSLGLHDFKGQKSATEVYIYPANSEKIENLLNLTEDKDSAA